MVVAIVSFASAWALSEGDYVYTKNGRFKIISSENLLTNGDFSDELNGWKSTESVDINSVVFSVTDNYDQPGTKMLRVDIRRNAAEGGGLFQSVAVNPGNTYIIYYKVKSDSETTASTLESGKDNYQNVFANSDGTTVTMSGDYFQNVGYVRNYGYDWREIGYDYTGEADYLNLWLYRLNVNDCFADFGIYEARQVSDDREVQRVIDLLTSYKENPLFTEGQSILDETIEGMRGMLDIEEKDVIDAAISDIEENIIREFLDLNSVDVTDYLLGADFNDARPATSAQTTISGWSTDGGRWFVKNPEEDSYGKFNSIFVEHSTNSRNVLPAGSIWQRVDLPAGKYMFSVQTSALRYLNWAGHVDEELPIEGIQLYVNDTKQDVTPLYNHRTLRYTVYADVAEDGNLTVGATIPERACHIVQFDNAQLRLIGGTQEQIDDYINGSELNSAKKELKQWIDSANVMLKSDKYFYTKAALADSVNTAMKAYTTATEVGELNLQIRYLRNTIYSFNQTNKEYHELAVNMESANGVLADDRYTQGKAALQTVVDEVAAYMNALNVAVRDSVGLVQNNDKLVSALNAFYTLNASYATPGSIAVVNPNFLDGTNGWDIYVDPAGKAIWQVKADSKFSAGNALVYSRGNSAHDPMYAWQDVNVTAKGLYEVTAEVRAFNAGWNYPSPTGVYLIIGDEKVELRTERDEIPAVVSLRTVVDAPTALRIGMDARDNTACSNLAISGVKLTYYGDYDQYKADSVKAEMAPAREALLAVISEADELKNSVRNPNGADTTPFENAIATAQDVYDNSIDIDAINAAAPALRKAMQQFKLSGVWPKAGTCFDLTFAIQNPDFGGDGKDATGWTLTGNENEGDADSQQPYLSYYYKSVATSRVAQQLDNMPLGGYQLSAKATYRLEMKDHFNFADYEASQPVYLFANNDSINVKGLLDEVDEEDVANTLQLTLDNYRRGRNLNQQFDAGLFDNTLYFMLTDTQTLTIGISVVEIMIRSGVFVDEFALRFYGDAPSLGISDAVRQDGREKVADRNVYDLQGRRVGTSLSTLKRGIYIWNGKKYIVK